MLLFLLSLRAATLPLLLFYYLGCLRFPLRNNSLIYISIFPPPRGVPAAAQTDGAARGCGAPPPTPSERWHVTEIGKESVTPASYSCWENSARYLLCATFISENCVVPRMECGGTQTRRRFSFASRQTPQRSAKIPKKQLRHPVHCAVLCFF